MLATPGGSPLGVPRWLNELRIAEKNGSKSAENGPNRPRTVPNQPPFVGAPGTVLGPFPPHDQPENGSFSRVLCQQFNSGIAVTKIRFSERFQTFAKSISAPNRPLWRSRAAKTTFQGSEKLNCAANVEKRLPATRLTGNIFLCERLLPPCKIFLCNAQNCGGGRRSTVSLTLQKLFDIPIF